MNVRDMNVRKCINSAIVAAAVLTLPAAAGAAQSATARYPDKPVRFIVPFAPGGGTDIVARVVAQKLTETFKQSVVVDNRGGGGGSIGTETAVRATPDGYTMIMVSGSYAANAALYKPNYDPVNDITPAALIGETGFIVGLHPGVPIRSIKEMIAYAKANPNKLNYGSTGTGGITHLATELFDLMAGTKMTHVPYKGTGPAITDLLGGQTQLIFGAMPAMVPHIKTNRLRGIAVTTSKRNPAVPDIPAVAETLPGYEAVLWYGVWGPKRLPREIVTLWNTSIRNLLKQAEVKERMAGEGLDLSDDGPERLSEIIKRDVAKWQRVVRDANVKVVQ